MTWWLIGVILMAGIGAGLLLARIERVRIRQDDPGPVDAGVPPRGRGKPRH